MIRALQKTINNTMNSIPDLIRDLRTNSKLIPAFAGMLFYVTMSISPAHAFCGFYVAKADADLFNQASKVIMARSENRTVITMANDFQGEVDEFAIVIPVPEILQEGQVHVSESRIIDHLDAYTAPRLVEYFDSDPCNQVMYKMRAMGAAMPMAAVMEDSGTASAKSLGVTIEASYSVGEYDILILSAKQSDGLYKWLEQEDYKLPEGAKKILRSYIKQDMKFFVAKVNLEKFEESGFTYLRPLQVAFESDKFMLPIRLGTLNSNGPQELILFTLTQKGRVETSNYRTVKMPTGQDLPLFVEDEFGDFYKAMFSHEVKKENMKTAFLEYAWDMGWCDPCAADPLPNEDLRALGVWWIDAPQKIQPVPMPGNNGRRPMIAPSPMPSPVNTFVTRLHIRYTAESFPEDLMLSETNDRQNFQGRYVMRHPFTGEASCEAGKQYYKSLPKRFEKEAKSLANITGWDIGDIRKKMEGGGQSFSIAPKTDERQWWEKMWEE